MEQISQEKYLQIIEDWKLEHKDEIKSEKCKKVFLENLPRLNNNKINWKLCRNNIVYFLYYNNIEGWVEIIRYNKDTQKLKIKYNNNEIEISTGHFSNCKLGNLLGTKTTGFKIEIGTRYQDKKRDIVIIDRKRERNKNGYWQKIYKCMCYKCGFNSGKHYSIIDKKFKDEYWITEGALLNKDNNTGCSCCGFAPKVIVENINSIYHTDPWMIPYIGEECAKTHTHSSDDKVYPTCPDCLQIKNKKMTISTIYKNHSIGCSCSDKNPYPEKIMFNVLKQLEIDFETQLSKTTFKWCDKYRYDFYFELNGESYICEVNGIQHYEENTNFKMSLKEQQENDSIKKELALVNGVKEENYIVIDCRYSELDFIKQNILNNIINKLFDLSIIDWLECEKFALSNLIKVACDYKRDNSDFTTGDIGKLMGYEGQTILKWLKKGNGLGWCDYNVKEEQIKNVTKAWKTTSKKLNIFKDGVYLGTFNSASELDRKSKDLFGVKLWQTEISKTCSGKKEEYKGYIIQYA